VSNRTRENKKLRRAVRKSMKKRMDEISTLPFKKRLVWAWRIVRGK